MRRTTGCPRRRGPRAGPRRLCLAVLLGLGALQLGCGDEIGATAVFVEVVPGEVPLGQTPDHLQVTWLGPKQGLFSKRRAPSSGSLKPDRNPMATLVIEVNERMESLERRVIVRALAGEAILGGGARRITVSPKQWITEQVAVTPQGLRDSDGDEVPDDVDDCPGQNDYEGCEPGAAGPSDGGRPVVRLDGSAGGDGPAVDGGVPGPPRDGPPLADRSAPGGADAPITGADGPVTPADASAPPTLLPNPPAELAARPVGAMAIDLSWMDAADNEREFQIERAVPFAFVTGARGFTRIATVPLNSVTYMDRTVSPGAFLAYRVRAANTIGPSPYSNVANAFTPPLATDTRLQGRVFGTMESLAGREPDKAFDNSATTFFEGKDVSGCYVGMEVGDGAIAITKVRYRPRATQAARMNGGKFQGSTTSQSDGYTDLHTIGALANDNLVEVVMPGTPFKFVRYFGPANSNCVIAEMEVYGKMP